MSDSSQHCPLPSFHLKTHALFRLFSYFTLFPSLYFSVSSLPSLSPRTLNFLPLSLSLSTIPISLSSILVLRNGKTERRPPFNDLDFSGSLFLSSEVSIKPEPLLRTVKNRLLHWIQPHQRLFASFVSFMRPMVFFLSFDS